MEFLFYSDSIFRYTEHCKTQERSIQFNLVRMQSPLSFFHSFSSAQLIEMLFLYQYEMLKIISNGNIYGVSRLELL